MISESIHEAYVSHRVAGQYDACRDVVEGVLAGGATLREVYERLFTSSLYEVGERWTAGRVTVAVEHRATAITERLLALVFPRALSSRDGAPRAVVACVVDEFHQLGGRIVADSLELLGWDTEFLGAGTPLARLVEVVAEREPSLVALSASLRTSLPNVISEVTELRAAAPAVPIVVGGHAFEPGTEGLFAGLRGVHHVRSLDDLEVFVRGLEG